jgi:hypothetical protein
VGKYQSKFDWLYSEAEIPKPDELLPADAEEPRDGSKGMNFDSMPDEIESE